jgi:hypothetical protein
MAARNALQDYNFISYLSNHVNLKSPLEMRKYHVFPPLHELLIDDLASIVLSSLDVDRLFDDSIRSTPKRPSSAVLTMNVIFSSKDRWKVHAWQGTVTG